MANESDHELYGWVDLRSKRWLLDSTPRIRYTVITAYQGVSAMPIVQIQKRMLISLAQIAKDVNLHEGDHILIEQRDGGIFLRPVDWVDKNQKYFWTKEWQEKMRRSQDALDNGDYKTFDNMEDAIKDLEALIDASGNKNQTI
jgi:hypothetical protein